MSDLTPWTAYFIKFYIFCHQGALTFENNFELYGRRLVDVDMIGWAILTSLAILIRNLFERCDLTTFEVVCIKTNSG